jgi:hypothetical protein
MIHRIESSYPRLCERFVSKPLVESSCPRLYPRSYQNHCVCEYHVLVEFLPVGGKLPERETLSFASSGCFLCGSVGATQKIV